MQNTKDNQKILLYSEELMTILPENNSFGIALFSESGDLLFANEAMKSLAPTFSSESLINPTFENLNSYKNVNSEIFSGFITIGELGKVNTTIEAKVFRKKRSDFIAGGINVAALIEQNKTMHFLNQRVTNLQRQIMQEKAELERTMKELRETQQMLIHSEKMNALGKLVAGVAHEVNNPIAFVYSNLHSIGTYFKDLFKAFTQIEQMVKESNSVELNDAVQKIRKAADLDYLEEDIGDMLSESKTGVNRVKTIVEDLRRFSRLDEADSKTINLIENIRSTISIVKAQMEQKNINFVFEGPETLKVECYPGQLNQAILNILINAIQAVPNQGEVKLSVQTSTSNVKITIDDNGSGIPSEIQGRIFEPFFTTKPVGSGTGLGLSVTYKIINELHKGSVSVKSEPGEHTSFCITIPLKQTNYK